MTYYGLNLTAHISVDPNSAGFQLLLSAVDPRSNEILATIGTVQYNELDRLAPLIQAFRMGTRYGQEKRP